ncbi:MAG: RagB/SusD family nutrient uptake outer membrane protein [Prevotellaceae bacterium]|nr:RagB/SusD family nutrient uptake outer membrane protein [Prevotellaceae bacterium]MDY6200451.1 RagB/SusD family nutrient uptake outer membrane protein [Prevotella sp.]
MKKYIMLALSGMLATSCIDTSVLPNDITIAEDYWKNKADVQNMVASAYLGMVSGGTVPTNLIVWGGFRSDELNPTETIINDGRWDDLKKINLGNLDKTNQYCNWATLYTVINRCNQVLERAPQVVEIDPAYTEDTYNTDKSQMLALRALCYFYLVRTFRDVPYNEQAYYNSSQEMMVAQMAPAAVLDKCINDLLEAERTPLSANAYDPTDWRRYGYINIDGVRAILADIYLWRASVTHSAEDYQKCVDYCNLVIESKKANYVPGRFETEVKEYPLALSTKFYQDVFVTENSQESIFELQMDGSHNSNTAIQYMYFEWKGGQKYGFMQASKVFGTLGSNAIDETSVFSTNADKRYFQACFNVSDADATYFDVRKMVDKSPLSEPTQAAQRPSASSGLERTNFGQNLIIYRLSDVMLMKAEALVQLADDAADVTTDDKLAEAFALVKYVDDRAIGEEPTKDGYRLKVTDYATKADMEKLVLAERLRELCFEGKRWYDLMRYNYRHVNAADYTKTMAELAGDNASMAAFPANSQEMMTIVQRKYIENAAAITSKIKNEAYLYFPVDDDEIKVNNMLKQNPAYADDDKYVKN